MAESVIDEIWLSLRLGLLDPARLDGAAQIAELDRYPDASDAELPGLLAEVEAVGADALQRATNDGWTWPPALVDVLGRQGLSDRREPTVVRALEHALFISGVTLDNVDLVALPPPPGAPPVPRRADAGGLPVRLLAALAAAIAALGVALWRRWSEHREAIDTDALTRTFNRRRLDRDLDRAQASGGLLSMVMIDIDHFKRINDELGHAAGDTALRSVAQVLRTSVRSSDAVYRYGGEEFTILLPDTRGDEAIDVCERARAAVEAVVATHDGRDLPPITISAGVATTATGDIGELAREADRALYHAKRAGRNRVLIAT